MWDNLIKEFEIYLTDAKGQTEKTIDSKMFDLDLLMGLYPKDLRTLTIPKVRAMKKEIRKMEIKNLKSLLRIHRFYINVRQFLEWLSDQPGYTDITEFDSRVISYFNLSNEDATIAKESPLRDFPEIDQVLELCLSISDDTMIGRRDIVIMAILFCYGIRNESIRTLKLGDIDTFSLSINQSPKKGVRTKGSKHIYTCFFKFDPYFETIIRDWIRELKDAGFKNNDPLIPNSKLERFRDRFNPRKNVEKKFIKSKGVINNILRQRAEEAGVTYYSAHCFRHSSAFHALKCVRDGVELKAVTQQYGHKTILLILTTYGNLSLSHQKETISKMNMNFENVFGF